MSARKAEKTTNKKTVAERAETAGFGKANKTMD